MLGAYASAAAILLASIVVGRCLLALVGHTAITWLSGAVGFAALVVASPLLIRLPGRAATLAALIGIAVLACLYYLWRGRDDRDRTAPGVPLAVILIVTVAASLPFAFNQRDGVLGEGIYTNDQAAQLYWTDWLQHGTGPEPSAVRFGYPTGPQALAAASAEATNASLLDAFNGLLLAIPVLTALAALEALRELPVVRRVAAGSLAGLPYLAASFLAQSAFKETAMALLVLAFAIAMRELGREPPDEARGPHPRRAMIVTLILFAAASVFVYSLPGLAWFAIAVPIWLVLELATGRMRIDLAEIRAGAARHRGAIIVVAVVLAAVAVFSIAQLSGFVGKVGKVQASAGRLSSPVFPGEALGIWPKGDFRVVRGEVTGAYLALALGLIAAALGAWALLRRREWALISMGVTTVIVYAGARAFASIYVEAKALAVMSPLVVLVVLRALFAERSDRLWRALGIAAAVCFGVSTLLALRAAPVGFSQRGEELESLAGLTQGQPVVFLGVDRFAGYWLRGTLVRSPGGYVPPEVKARPNKVWQQGLAMDLDTLSPRRLDQFDYAVTTNAAYASAAPPNFSPVTRTASYTLWKRSGHTPKTGVIDKDGTPGRVLDCADPGNRRISHRKGIAVVRPEPVTGDPSKWNRSFPFDAPGNATQVLKLPPGRWDISLQYASQVPLRVTGGDLDEDLPPSLDGMYLTHQGEGAFWEGGATRVERGQPLAVTVHAAKPSGFQRLAGVRRQVWLGSVAATRVGSSKTAVGQACGRYLDHFFPGAGGANR